MIRTARWSDAPTPDDGHRLLITRYRPRGVAKGSEPWDRWDKRLSPSIELLDAFFGRRREGRKVVSRDLEPISFAELARRYKDEMKGEEAQAALEELRRLAQGEAMTLLCYCQDESRCHRSLVAGLLGG